ncbi:MAG TPA: hypothetical protein VGJ54_14370 [Streptosporangiaceae bacterium]|jgi:hypothetical protein
MREQSRARVICGLPEQQRLGAGGELGCSGMLALTLLLLAGAGRWSCVLMIG